MLFISQSLISRKYTCFLVSLIDYCQEDVCKDEDKQHIKREEKYYCHGRVHLLQVNEFELSNSYLETHPYRTTNGVVSNQMRSKW